MLGVILMNLGGPSRVSEIRPFLARLFGDREIIRLPGGPLVQPAFAQLVAGLRAGKVRKNYEAIGGGSPLLRLTRRQAAGLRAALAGRGIEACVEIAMRYAAPRAAAAVERIHRAGADRLVALTLYPQFSAATTGSSLADLERAREKALCGLPLEVVDRYFDHPGYLDALAEKVREGLAGCPGDRRDGVVLLFTAHSLPRRMVAEGDPYVLEIERTVEGLRERLPPGQPWRLAFQSRAGPVRWVGPSTDAVIRELGREGALDVLAVPVAFVSDHVETLHEIDVEYAELARKCGIPGFRRAPSLNDSPRFVAALADLVEEAVR